MIETNYEVCNSCIYSKRLQNGNGDCYCDYLLMTGERRGCKVGECDKYKERLNNARTVQRVFAH